MAKLSPPLEPPTIHRATRGARGRVIRGEEISEAEAVAQRRLGRDVVVCGDSIAANREAAKAIEAQVGPYKAGEPHTRVGPYVLPHFQPEPRPPAGHTFYETEHRKAAKNP